LPAGRGCDNLPRTDSQVSDGSSYFLSQTPALTDIRIRALHVALERRRPRLVEVEPDIDRASVALLVRPVEEDLEILLIQRPIAVDDPWSGHMALPGGRSRTGEDPLETAVRETLEEVGVDLLGEGMLIGRLDDVPPNAGGPQIAVAPFVFAVPAGVAVAADPREVASTVWIPLEHLARPTSAAEHLHLLPDGGQLSFPAFAYKRFVIWGLTYRMLIQFLGIARSARPEEVF
jgi:8-oxo-dGTP pyrophosphatase MutT (NUDIX family)